MGQGQHGAIFLPRRSPRTQLHSTKPRGEHPLAPEGTPRPRASPPCSGGWCRCREAALAPSWGWLQDTSPSPSPSPASSRPFLGRGPLPAASPGASFRLAPGRSWLSPVIGRDLLSPQLRLPDVHPPGCPLSGASPLSALPWVPSRPKAQLDPGPPPPLFFSLSLCLLPKRPSQGGSGDAFGVGSGSCRLQGWKLGGVSWDLGGLSSRPQGRGPWC